MSSNVLSRGLGMPDVFEKREESTYIEQGKAMSGREIFGNYK